MTKLTKENMSEISLRRIDNAWEISTFKVFPEFTPLESMGYCDKCSTDQINKVCLFGSPEDALINKLVDFLLLGHGDE